MLLKKHPCWFFIFTYLIESLKYVSADLSIAGIDGKLAGLEPGETDSVWDVGAVESFFGHVKNLQILGGGGTKGDTGAH